MLADQLDSNILRSRTETAAASTGIGSRRRRGDWDADPARCALFHAAYRQIAENRGVSCRAGRVRERPLHLEPLEGHARHAVLLGERVDILFLAAVHTRPEEAHGVGLDCFGWGEEDLHLLDRRIGRELERRKRTGLPGALGIHPDWLIAATAPHLIGIGPVVGGLVQICHFFGAESREVPVVDSAATDPNCVALDPNAVASCGWDAKAAPIKSAGIGEDAGDAADGLALLGFGIRDCASAGADFGLRVR